MKCPYRQFKECILQECPSCNYETVECEEIQGTFPAYMDSETAIKQGYAWRVKKKKYKFLSCKLVENNVQPIPKNETVINNKTNTSVLVHRSIF